MSCLGRPKIYAIIETGGKQYKVSPGQVVDIDRLEVSDGSTIELDKVLLIADKGKVTIGTPTVEGVMVLATTQGESRAKKVIVFRYKPKVRYRKKTGHHQLYTRLAIDKIIEPGAVQDEPAKKARRSKKEVIESGT